MKKLLLSFLVLGMFFQISISSVRAEKEETKVSFNPRFESQRVSTDINEIVTHRLTNLSSESISGYYDSFTIAYRHFKGFEATELEEITIPYMTAIDIDGNLLEYSNIVFMAITPSMNDWVVDPVVISKDNPSYTLKHEDLVKWANEKNEGKLPNALYIHISFQKEPKFKYYGEKVKSMNIEQDIIFKERLVNKPLPWTDYAFSQFYLDLSVYLESNYNSVDTRYTSYIFPETSTVKVNYDDTKNYRPGEEIELEFEIENDTEVDNKLSLLLLAPGLELVDQDFFDNTSANEFISKGDKAFYLKANSDMKIVQKFRIKEDFNDDNILLSPALRSSYAVEGWDFDAPTIINLVNDHIDVPNDNEYGDPEDTPISDIPSPETNTPEVEGPNIPNIEDNKIPDTNNSNKPNPPVTMEREIPNTSVESTHYLPLIVLFISSFLTLFFRRKKLN